MEKSRQGLQVCRGHVCWSPLAIFFKLDIVCHSVSFPNYLFFSFLSTFASKRGGSHSSVSSSSPPTSSFSLRGSAWHEVSTFHFPGLPHQQREYTWLRCKEEEQKQCRDKKCKNWPQRRKKGRGSPFWQNWVCRVMVYECGPTVPPDTVNLPLIPVPISVDAALVYYTVGVYLLLRLLKNWQNKI